MGSIKFAIIFCTTMISAIAEMEPLFLSPIIRAGRIEEAQNLSKVEGLGEGLELESYSGLITVNEDLRSHMFFWFY
jgi:hypothetical protein